MNNFYEKLSDLYPYNDTVTMTILEGEFLGEKAIYSKGTLIFESKEGIFPALFVNEDNKSQNMMQSEHGRVFFENLGNQKKMIICGGGHVSIPVIEIAKMIGFHVTVIEDRIQFADNIRRTKADEVICEDFKIALSKIKSDGDTYFVIVTRGHRYDQVCLEEILGKENAYIGMIGSKVRVRQLKEVLIEKGYEKEFLDKMYSPIGLKIGGETPEEIAVSVLAEIIQVKNQVKRSGGYTKEIMSTLLNEEMKEIPKILATIISRKGSAPREVGTKMLIFKDGTIVGTIGGGCVEADICTKARFQLMEEEKEPKLYTVDMTGRDAEEEGMVCGGIIEILLEVV